MLVGVESECETQATRLAFAFGGDLIPLNGEVFDGGQDGKIDRGVEALYLLRAVEEDLWPKVRNLPEECASSGV